MMKQLWMDECGGLLSAELVLVSTLLFCGIALGVNEVRNAILQELADTADMIGSIDQSYSLGGVQTLHGQCSGQAWTDAVDENDGGCQQDGGNGGDSRGVVVCDVDAGHEGA